MAFTNLTFIFLFLPVFFLVYVLLPKSWPRSGFLLLASIFFYFWAEPRHIRLILLLILLNYLLARIISSTKKEWLSRTAYILAILVNLAILIFYKSSAFFIQNLLRPLGFDLPKAGFALPLGLSFITFSALSYLFDLYHDHTLIEKNLIRFASFVMLFPKLTQGPITRYQAIREQLKLRSVPLADISAGIQRALLGLAKKVLIADNMGVVAERVFQVDLATLGAGTAWYGLLAFNLQIYFDFSGYTDIAIGLGRILGFDLPENFNFPYIAHSMADFWRRWHMTLTEWFRRYVFTPLEFKRRREKFLRLQTDILIVFLLTGFWHGSTWNYILWGLYHGLFLAVEASSWGEQLKKLPRVLQHFYTLLAVALGWVLFRFRDPANWLPFLKALAGFNGWSGFSTLRTLNILSYMPLFILGWALSAPLGQLVPEKVRSSSLFKAFSSAASLGLFLMSVACLVSRGYQAFLYRQF